MEDNKIVIRLPSLRWQALFSLPSLLSLSALLALLLFSYWYQSVRPYLWISSAYVEAYSATISSDLVGRIVEMGPLEGEFVKKGQLLFRLDSDLIHAQQAQLRQSIDAVHAQIEAEKERIGKAMEAYVTASSELEIGIGSSDRVKKELAAVEDAQAKIELAIAKIGALKSELGLLDLQVKKMTLSAPFDGVVLKRSQNPGTAISFGEPLYILCDPSRMWIEAQVPESELAHLVLGQPVQIRLPAYPAKEWTGKISYIGSATVAKSSLTPLLAQKEAIPIRISMEQASLSLKPGLSAQVRLKVR